MEITNILLNDLGADPKVYTAEEKQMMGDFADKIKAGELSALLAECALPEERLLALKASYGRCREELAEAMNKIAALAEELAGTFAKKNSIFTASLSEIERDTLLMSGFHIMQRISALREKTLDTVGSILAGMEELYSLQCVYNTTLARLGMINIAARAAETEGASYEENAIMDPILDAYDKLTDFTAFTNDMKDKAVIYQKACEERLGFALDALSRHLDLMGDGKNMSVSGIMEDAAAMKRIAADVLHTHI